MWGTEEAGPLLESGHPDTARKWKGGASAWLAAEWSRPGRLISWWGYWSLDTFPTRGTEACENSHAFHVPFLGQNSLCLAGWHEKTPRDMLQQSERLLTWRPLAQTLPGYGNYWLCFFPGKLNLIWEATFSYWFGARIFFVFVFPSFSSCQQGKQTQCKIFQ